MNGGIVSEEAIAESDIVCSGRRQAFLIALPGATLGGQLIDDGFSRNVIRCRYRTSIDANEAERT